MFVLTEHPESHHKFEFCAKGRDGIPDEVASEIIRWCQDKFGRRQTWNYDNKGWLMDCPIQTARWRVICRARAYCLFYFRDYTDAFEFRMRWC